jgi:MFS family permease
MIKFPKGLTTGLTAYAAVVGAPLRHSLFRRIWVASLASNFGMLIQGVGAAWAMTEMTNEAKMVALVATASTLPTMLLSIPAGAVADMYDRRIISLVATLLTFGGSVALALLAYIGLMTPYALLVFCFIIASGTALFGPAWQASVSEQVPPESLPSAIALNSINYNIARSFGPAIGGLVVAAFGAIASFVANAILYLPLIAALVSWKRVEEPSRLPPERLSRAIVSGGRYVAHSPPIRIVLTRSLFMCMAGAAAQALLPLVARDLLGGGAPTYGILLGAFGFGAVIAGINVAAVKRRFGPEESVRALALMMGVAMAVMALSPWMLLTVPALVLMGGSWMMSLALFNISVQFSAPRWVSGRALAAFRTSSNGGLAIGGYLCGLLADTASLQTSLLVSALAMLVSAALGLRQPLPAIGGPSQAAADVLEDPEVRLQLKARSGPIVVEVEYRVDADHAREFHNVMQEVQLSRKRNGAYGWSIARDLTDPELWTERYHLPTWLDYLRHRNRPTQAERELRLKAVAFHLGPGQPKVRRMLERPFGSVRWHEDTPDRAGEHVHAHHH